MLRNFLFEVILCFSVAFLDCKVYIPIPAGKLPCFVGIGHWGGGGTFHLIFAFLGTIAWYEFCRSFEFYILSQWKIEIKRPDEM